MGIQWLATPKEGFILGVLATKGNWDITRYGRIKIRQINPFLKNYNTYKNSRSRSNRYLLEEYIAWFCRRMGLFIVLDAEAMEG